MKQLTALATCLLIAGALHAQTTTKVTRQVMPPITTLPQRNKAIKKSAIGGFLTDTRRRPIKNVKAYIYNADSTIAASGYSDSLGYYETNTVKPGLYDLKITYPTARYATMITGVPVLVGKITNISFLKADAPVADTAIAYTDIAPLPPEKHKGTVKSTTVESTTTKSTTTKSTTVKSTTVETTTPVKSATLKK